MPTTDQLRSILDYISPVSGTGGQGGKAVYGIGELVKGAKDVEDAVKKFKEDQERFVRPVVGFLVSFGSGILGDDFLGGADVGFRLLIG